MKKQLCRLGFVCMFFLSLAPSVCSASADDAAIAAVLAADQARGAALLAADTNTLATLLADDLRYTHSNGKLETKSIHIGTLINGLRYARFKTSNVVAHVITPDVVVLNGIIDQRKGVAEKWTDMHLMFHAVWRKKSAAWQLASLQTAVLPAPAN